MSMGRLMDELHPVHIATSGFIADYSDYTTGNPATDVVSLANYDSVLFLILKSSGATGTATITVESCDNVTPDTATAIAFTYWTCTTPDTWGEATAATSSGFTTTASADDMYAIEINSSQLSGTDQFVRLQFTEVDSTACDGAVLCILGNPRIAKGIMHGALA